jgi:hypothetical protein
MLWGFLYHHHILRPHSSQVSGFSSHCWSGKMWSWVGSFLAKLWVSTGRFCVCKHLSCRILLNMLFELDICIVWEVLKLFSFILQIYCPLGYTTSFVVFFRYTSEGFLFLPRLDLCWFHSASSSTCDVNWWWGKPYLFVNQHWGTQPISCKTQCQNLSCKHPYFHNTKQMWQLPTNILDICVVFYVLPWVALQKKSEIVRLALLIPNTKNRKL